MPRGDVLERIDTSESTDAEGIEGKLEEILIQMRRRARGVRGAVVADRNGLSVARDIRNGLNAAVLAAMSTLIAESSSGVFDNLGMAAPDFILMESPEGNVAVMHMADGEVSLLVLAEKSTNLGILKIEMQRAARGIAESLGLAFGLRSRISELFLLHRNGILIRHYSDSLRTDADRDILGGMLVGVQDFVKQTLSSKSGSLDQMRYGEYTIFFIRGSDVVVAAVAKDADAVDVQYRVLDAIQDLEERYGPILKNWDGDMGAFPGIDESFEKVLRG